MDEPRIGPTPREAIFSPIMATFSAGTGIPAAVRAGDTVYVTGHTGEDADLSYSPDAEHQIRRTFANIAEIPLPTLGATASPQ